MSRIVDVFHGKTPVRTPAISRFEGSLGVIGIAAGAGGAARGSARGEGRCHGVVSRCVAKATTWGGRGVFGPELEAAFYAEGGEQIGVDCWWEPLELVGAVLISSAPCKKMECGGSYLENFPAMRAPVIAVPPYAVFVSVEDANLAVD